MRVRGMVALIGFVALSAAAQQQVDGIAARLGQQVITESEVDELGRYQQLIDGRAQDRATRLRELIEQMLIADQMARAGYAPALTAQVEQAYRRLEARFGTGEALRRRLQALGLSEARLRWYLHRTLAVNSFLEHRFRPQVSVSDDQIARYYYDELVPQLRCRGLPLPPLAVVKSPIRELLIEREINRRAAAWLEQLRSQLATNPPAGQGE